MTFFFHAGFLLMGGECFSPPTPRASAPRTSHLLGRRTALAAAISSDGGESDIPKLIVFDLDNTIWTPELYQLRNLQRSNKYPTAHRDVKLFKGSEVLLETIRRDREVNGRYVNTQFAVASRTKSVDWAHHLLKEFDLKDKVFDHIEIFPGDKIKHFANLKQATGIDYEDMLFFDDARDGKYGNCEPVSSLGVLSVHCPNGLYDEDIYGNALTHYKKWRVNATPGTIIEWDNSVTTTKPIDSKKRHVGAVKYINSQKRFGFIEYGDRSTKDMWFHFNSLDVAVDVGDELTFNVVKVRGKLAASNIEVSKADNDDDLVDFRVFSMNLPFAALLSNGYKTLETRNGTMFVPYEPGTKMLLHIGQRIYPDGNRHIKVMKSGGLKEEEIEKLKSLPQGFRKGHAVAIVELGETYETTLEQRSEPDFQRSVGAFGEDSGMRATEIRRVEYLKRPVKVSGRGGVFKAKVPRDVIPDGWLENDNSSVAAEQNGKNVYYSATF